MEEKRKAVYEAPRFEVLKFEYPPHSLLVVVSLSGDVEDYEGIETDDF